MRLARLWTGSLAGAAMVAISAAVVAGTSPDRPDVTVYKTRTCGCCKKWIDHLEKAGFEVTAHDMDDLAEVKTNLGVKPELQSCHTAVVDGYVVEGHVPADLVERMLEERPKVAGLAVPGMPMGSPGMEGDTKDRYDVLTFDKSGKTAVYATR